MITKAPKTPRLTPYVRPEKAHRMRRSDPAFKRMRWDKLSTKEIARRTGWTLVEVSQERRKHAPHTVQKHEWNPGRWETVNWALTNSEIAKMLGTSRQLVGQTRARKFPSKKADLTETNCQTENIENYEV